MLVSLFREDEFICDWDDARWFVNQFPSSHSFKLVEFGLNGLFPFWPLWGFLGFSETAAGVVWNNSEFFLFSDCSNTGFHFIRKRTSQGITIDSCPPSFSAWCFI